MPIIHNINHYKILLTIVKKKKKQKKKKFNLDKKIYICNFCKKTYFSNPALYTHKRNKHNIFPISGAGEDFKEILKDMREDMNIRYSDYESSNNFQQSVNYIIEIYLNKMINMYRNAECILYSEDYNVRENKLYLLLNSITQTRIDDIMNLERSFSPIIDEVLVTYMITFFKITKHDKLTKLIVKFCILLREYLNISGWNFKKNFINFNIPMAYDRNGSFCQMNDCEYIPDLINDFVSVFMELDVMFNIESKLLYCITDNFCNWLFVNNLTNFKLSPNELSNVD
jgi:hypothetical protein